MIKNINPKLDYPVADHVHFYGMYIGKIHLKKKSNNSLSQVINNV